MILFSVLNGDQSRYFSFHILKVTILSENVNVNLYEQINNTLMVKYKCDVVISC